MDINQIKPAIIDYLSNLRTSIRVDKALLFGSFVRGDATPESDLDMLIISKDFAPLNEDERLRILYRASVGFPRDLHVYGVTPEEFQQASPLTTLGNVRSQQTIRIV
ncbi:nucleotidyltransferase domain-containing protein [Candidatus Gottesmanbacteria bacterium]|nr:nucleotidyltransferase domain-containing protein [Candidatus Gottesmanbacteria bacterium]